MFKIQGLKFKVQGLSFKVYNEMLREHSFVDLQSMFSMTSLILNVIFSHQNVPNSIRNVMLSLSKHLKRFITSSPA